MNIQKYVFLKEILALSRHFGILKAGLRANYRNLFSWLVTMKDIIIANVIVMFSRGMHY